MGNSKAATNYLIIIATVDDLMVKTQFKQRSLV